MLSRLSLYLSGIVLLSLAGCENRDRNGSNEDSNNQIIEAVTKIERINPYPRAVRVNLLVGDIGGSDLRLSTNPSGIDLNQEQIKELTASLQKVTVIEYGNQDSASGCFIPHHFVRYYDNEDKLIGDIELCFCCEGIMAYPSVINDTKAQYLEADYERLKRMMKDMDVPTDVDCF